MTSFGLPGWLRIALVAGIVVLVAGVGLFAYRWYTRPTTLSIAVGSLDGEAARIITAIAGRFTEKNAAVRLNIVEMAGAAESAAAFASGKTDLAIVRGDVGDLSKAQAVIVAARAVALLVALPGSSAEGLADLKRATIGVVAGETNRKLVSVLGNEYDFGRANVKFKDVAPADARRALESKEVRALLVVVPLTEKYLSLVRGLFPQNTKAGLVLIPIESAGAIAEKDKAYESFDVPKGTFRGSPPVPAEDVTTLKVSYYLVAKKALDADLITELTKELMNVRRDLIGELPILSQVAAADTDSDAYLPVHPGAAAFYNGTQLSFLDRWGNAIFLAPMIIGGLISVAAAAWQFLGADDPGKGEQELDALYAFGPRIRAAESEAELSEIEREIDALLQAQRTRSPAGDENALDVTTLNVAAHRLQSLIHDRRMLLASHASDETPA
ncbi:MAG TPA: TAXI family TRAP transporter solute-binding subunit [Bradyrhizobium sp.]|nr:TAXI family TRAP transporter solute-binding subunit [Bradyrhizobium sp.]